MAKEFAKKFYQSKAWRETRKAYFQYQHGLCERCSDNAGKIVHHKEYLTPQNITDPTIALAFSNLELLCQECHNREHNQKHSPTVEGLMFDDNGDLVKGNAPVQKKKWW